MGQIFPEPELDWDLGPPRRWDPRHLIVVIAGVVTVVAVAVIVLQTRDSEPPAPPVRAVAPAVALAMPSDHEGDGGYPVGFPRTELGAASAAAAALEAAWTLDVGQAEQAAALYAPPDQQKAARDGAREAVRGWRETLGLPVEGDLPAGAALRTQTIGVQWNVRSDDQVQVSVLVKVTATTGAGGNGPVYSSPYAMSLLMAWAPDMRGTNKGDWVNIPDPTPPSVPAAALPGTPEFAAAGWKSLVDPRPTP
ncbi:hypothetical protein DI270_031880 [Microbispora triticiradicis]|uniref:Uncharacterized protein n=3 Tax=Microbispora TaxID=2005 RepID=A0ABY3M2P2_9ACTN|nr:MULTISPECIES: hypothetical protein [Microbispora]RGA00997.1 hypothetical protein DI270_031880 [Microbispora triticiradicis]TLP57747.1 hypothetical protein FED44_19380 [Microbispora fusca]TYB64657.1 hypothetical protein FXF59_07505 [Microbispora tritici]GLW25172.1 hypothetical protein Mame01_52140 [Microbispora amethystogenes]